MQLRRGTNVHSKADFTIVVVDDDDLVRDVVRSILIREGYHIILAKSGDKAIDIVKHGNVNLVITDLRMPDADGMEVLKQALQTDPNIAVAILTAYGTLDAALEAVKQGAYDYLTKPFKTQEIILLAEQAYQRSVLIRLTSEMKQRLRDTYLNHDLISAVRDSARPGLQSTWMEWTEGLVALGILTSDEASGIKKRVRTGSRVARNDHS